MGDVGQVEGPYPEEGAPDSERLQLAGCDQSVDRGRADSQLLSHLSDGQQLGFALVPDGCRKGAGKNVRNGVIRSDGR